MTQFQFYKSFLFVAELLLAEYLYLYRFRRHEHYVWRLIAGIAASFLFAFLLPTFSDNSAYSSLLFLLIFLFTVVMYKFVYNESTLTVVFCCLAGYTTQHLSYEIYNTALVLMNVSVLEGFYGNSPEFWALFPNLFLFAIYLFIYVGTYFVCYFFFGSKLENVEDVYIEKSFIFIFSILILLVDILLNAIVVFNPLDGAELYIIIISVYNILCCIVSLFFQFEFTLRRKAEKEFDTLQEMWNRAKKQYEMTKENIELINMKCHDFKHQIHKLGNYEVITPGVLKELEDNISIYDSIVKTGNDALDIILTEKSLLCNKENIQFSCIVDGKKLSFMRNEDIYAVFGNIIDNAIEAVLKVEPAKRTIDLRVRFVEGLLIVNASNYYEEELIYKDDKLQTTKEEKFHHGFGIRSIQYVCERYGGEVNISAENNIFTISILFFLDSLKKN